MIEFFQNYFRQPVEGYYYINLIPEYRFFGLPDHFYFYAVIVLGLSLFLIFIGIFIIRRWQKINLTKIFIYFILIFWLLTSIRWMVIQAQWLKNDMVDFSGQSITRRRAMAMTRIVQGVGLPESWYDFYDFLEFARQEIPVDSAVYLLPADSTFWIWSKYWLYPDLDLVDSFERARYIISFNVDLPEQVAGFEKFKEFAPNKFILKRI